MSVEENVAKKLKTSKMIGTHNGTFHCDEALAVFLLRQTGTYRDADLTRTRDPKLLDTCDIVVDVGAVYDPEKLRFDHHQREFDGVFGHGYSTKLSSAGLIYKHYGKEIISGHLNLSPEDPKVETLWLKLYKVLIEYIEAIDGVDNGVQQYPPEIPPKYRIRTDVSTRVGWLNPAWNESVDSKSVDVRFEKASKLVGEEFISRLEYYGNAWLPARELVQNGLEARSAVSPSGHIILFEHFCPWKEHLFDLEKELSIPDDQKPIYIVYPDETAGNWRIQAVPISPDSFISRKPLPEPWRGVRDDALSTVSGIPGGIFVHASGFIGGNQTQAGALEMARRALAM
ncbi:hypothetical protein FRC05_002170 [Tulasnella sp. 425]|nr:hypothetical protein FRC05_002170 [Tulasnella sp. 425]